MQRLLSVGSASVPSAIGQLLTFSQPSDQRSFDAAIGLNGVTPLEETALYWSGLIRPRPLIVKAGRARDRVGT